MLTLMTLIFLLLLSRKDSIKAMIKFFFGLDDVALFVDVGPLESSPGGLTVQPPLNKLR